MAKTINIALSFEGLRAQVHGTAKRMMDMVKEERWEDDFLDLLEAVLDGEERTIENIERLMVERQADLI